MSNPPRVRFSVTDPNESNKNVIISYCDKQFNNYKIEKKPSMQLLNLCVIGKHGL